MEVAKYLGTALSCHGCHAKLVYDSEEGFGCLKKFAKRVGLVILDGSIPPKGGIQTLRDIRRLYPGLPVIFVSADASPSLVVKVMRNGAVDFFPYPIAHADLMKAVEKHLGADPSVPSASSPALASSPQPLPDSGGKFLFINPRMKQIRGMLKRIANSDVPVILYGESGTGKEVVAQTLHQESPRLRKPFLKLNCAAVPSELLESELFGYERGAFTGAFKDTPGKFEMADGGTILLDEIGDMAMNLQAKLLHALQDKQFQRLGGTDTVEVNVRVLAATHRNLKREIQLGEFRLDLFYRLNVIQIFIPPLRERKDEILPFADLFLRKYVGSAEWIPKIPDDLKKTLLSYDWPGNVRELENVMRRLLVLQNPPSIIEDLQENMRALSQAGPAVPAEVVSQSFPLSSSKKPAAFEKVNKAKAQMEVQAICAALEATHWNRKKAAGLLNLDYKALLYKLKKLGIGAREPA